MNKKQRFIGIQSIVFLLLLALFVQLPVKAFAAPVTKTVNYLALGDSLAAGLTPDSTIGTSYTDLLAEHISKSGFLGEFNKKFAFPGYTSQHVLDNIKNNVAAPNGVTIQQSITKSDVITLNVGANDFIQKLDSNYSMSPALAESVLLQASINIGAILTEIRKINPTASIYFMGYYDAFYNFSLQPVQKQLLTVVLDKFNTTIAAISLQAGAIFIPTKDAIAVDYLNNLPNITNIHPSVQGYKAIADAMWKVMQTPFAWSPASSLTATNVASTSVALNWTPIYGQASDYKIYKGTTEIGTVSGSVYTFNANQLSADTSYAFKVEAKLSNGLWTTNGPQLTQKTAAASTSGSTTIPLSPVNQLTVNQLNDLIKSSTASTYIPIDLKTNNHILLPNNTGELLQLSKQGLEVKSSDQSVLIPSSVLIDLSKQLTADVLKDAQIKISFKAVDTASVSSSVYAANAASGAVINPHGFVYEFDLTIESKDGKSTKLSHFKEPVALKFKITSTATNPELLGIYYLNETTKKWEYVGAKRSSDNRTIEAALSHNSKYAVLEYTKTYKDVPSSHWALASIQALSAKQVVEGITAETFGPSQTTTRAQFVTMLIRSLNIQTSGTAANFTDVASGAWYSEAIATAVQAGIVKGIDDNHFAPNASITREQMAALLVRAYEYKSGISLLKGDKLPLYKDADQVSIWAVDDVNKAIEAGFMTGHNANSFVPDANTVRAETAKAIYNLLAK